MDNPNEKNNRSTFHRIHPTPDPRFVRGPPQASSPWILPNQNHLAITQPYQPSVEPSTLICGGGLEHGTYDFGTLHQVPTSDMNPMTSTLPPAYGTALASGMLESQSISYQQHTHHPHFHSGNYSVQHQYSRPSGAQRRASTSHVHTRSPLQYHAKLAQGNIQFHQEIPLQPAPAFHHQQQRPQPPPTLLLQHLTNPHIPEGHSSLQVAALQAHATQDMVSMTVKPTNIQDPRSFLTHDTELSGPSSEKQVISLTVATNNLALTTPTTSPVTATGSTASVSRAKSKKRTGVEGRRTSTDTSQPDIELVMHKKIANKRSRDQLNKAFSSATVLPLLEQHHQHQYQYQYQQLQLQLQLQLQQRLQADNRHYSPTANNSNANSASPSVSLTPSPRTGLHPFTLQKEYSDSSRAPALQYQPPLPAQHLQASSNSIPCSIGNHCPLDTIEGVSVSSIQRQVFQKQAQIQQQQHNQQQEQARCRGPHAPLPPKHPLYHMPHQTPSLPVLTPFPNAVNSPHTSSSTSSSSSAPFLPFSEKAGRSLYNQVVSVDKPKQVAQQYLYIAQTIMNNEEPTSPPEPSTPFGGEVSDVGFMRILEKEEDRHLKMEILHHQQPHLHVVLQQDQSYFLVPNQLQQLHHQGQSFQARSQGSSESTSPSIVSAPPSSLSQSIQQQLQQREQQQEEDFMQQEAALNKLKDLFDQNDLNELDTHSEEESLLFQTMPPGRPVNIETRGRSRTLPERSTYSETLGQPHLHSHSNHHQQHREQQVEVQQVQQAQDTLFDSTTLGDFSNQNQSAQEPLEALKTVSSLSLEALDHPFMMGASTALLAPGSSASPPPSWLLESDLGVGLVDDPDDGEAENNAADDWSSAQADESGTTTKGVRRVGGRAIGGSRPNSSTSPKYECPLCNRFYTRPFNLRSHMLVHEDKKPFACELCDSRFTRRHDMVRHIKTRHKNQQQDVVGEGIDGGGPAPVAGTGPAAIPLQARSQEERDGSVKDTLEGLQ